MKRSFKIIRIAFVALTFYQCSPSTDQKVAAARDGIKRDISKEKQSVVNDLRWLRDDINDRLDEISMKLETASDKSKGELEEAKLNLLDHRAKVEKSLNEIDQSADDNWDEIQQNCRNTSNEVKAEFDKLSNRIENALGDN